MEETPDRGSRIKKLLIVVLKIVITIVCLWYVSGKIDFAKTANALSNANWIFIFLALLAFIVSKLISALRLNIYFKNIGLYLPTAASIRLYWLGMFYNLFLPGSIGGDAYKVILLSKKYSVPYKKTTAAVLLDRISGLLGLGILLAFYSIPVLGISWISTLVIGGAVLSVVALYFIVKKYFPDFIPGFTSTLMLGILVQLSQVVCAYLIMAALNIPAHATEYIFLFLVSSVVAVLPLTIGGLGGREIVFLEGSIYFGLVQENSVIISLIFYLITLITSAWGALYIFRNPLRSETSISSN